MERQVMNYARTASIIILIPFLALTAYALLDVGYIGLLENQLSTPAGLQVFTDLSIALVMVVAWLVSNARHTGRNPWPYVITTLFAGSIGPLLYLALTPKTRAE